MNQLLGHTSTRSFYHSLIKNRKKKRGPTRFRPKPATALAVGSYFRKCVFIVAATSKIHPDSFVPLNREEITACECVSIQKVKMAMLKASTF